MECSLLSQAGDTKTSKKCGFLAIMGKANAGKSTLLNGILGQKLAAVSRKAHTTRFGVYGILCAENNQIIFVDTPGLLPKGKNVLHNQMRKSTFKQGRDTDGRLVVIDASIPFSPMVETLLGPKRATRIPEQEAQDSDDVLLQGPPNQILAPKPLMIVLNKVDKIPKEQLLPLAEFYSQWSPDIAMISAREKKGLQRIVSWACSVIPQEPWAFSGQEVSQISQRIWAAELTREKLFTFLHQEIPYHIHVETEEWKENSRGIVIKQTIWVDDERYRKWILGFKGQRIRQVGILARQELGQELEKEVHLFLSVKEDKKLWQNIEEMP